MQTQRNSDTILTGRDGFLVCPNCRSNKRLMKILPDTTAANVVAFCRICKAENIVDIDHGQCYLSRSR